MQRTTSQEPEYLLQEVIDACWLCGGHGGELHGDKWIPCHVCRSEFAVPLWFRRWRARIHSSSIELERWMQTALPKSLEIWSNPMRCASGAPFHARLMGIGGRKEEIFTELHRCSCQVFDLAEICLHQVAHEWVRRSLQACDGFEILQEDPPVFLLGAENPVWGYRLRLEWWRGGWAAVAHAPDGEIYKFPCIQSLADNFYNQIEIGGTK